MTTPLARIGQVYETTGLPGFDPAITRYAVVTGSAPSGAVIHTLTTDKNDILKETQAITITNQEFPELFRPTNRTGLPPVVATKLSLYSYVTKSNLNFIAEVFPASDHLFLCAPEYKDVKVLIGSRVSFRIPRDAWERIQSRCPQTHSHLFSDYDAIS
jgi:hypothetical protein